MDAPKNSSKSAQGRASQDRSNWIKTRHLPLAAGTDPVSELLQVKGVISAELVQNNILSLEYDLREIDLTTLLAQGVTTNATGYKKFLIRLYCHNENTQRSWTEKPSGWQACVQNVYVNHYLFRQHAKIDKRPQHWQQYIDKLKVNEPDE